MRISTQGGSGILWLITILVIAGGVFLLFKNRGDGSESVPSADLPDDESFIEDTPVEAAVVTVVYAEEGFSPKTVTVKLGDTVVFENKTGKPASVASAVHPTHLLYPEFDQYKTDQKGKDEFRFSFEKVGTWNYHDHLAPTMTGIVIVE